MHTRHDIKITFNCVNLIYPLHIAKKELISGQFSKEMSEKSFQEVKKNILHKEPLLQYQFSIKIRLDNWNKVIQRTQILKKRLKA